MRSACNGLLPPLTPPYKGGEPRRNGRLFPPLCKGRRGGVEPHNRKPHAPSLTVAATRSMRSAFPPPSPCPLPEGEGFLLGYGVDSSSLISEKIRSNSRCCSRKASRSVGSKCPGWVRALPFRMMLHVFLMRKGRFVRSHAPKRVIGIPQHDHAPAQGNGLAFQALRVAAPVPPFMMREGDVPRGLQEQ